MRIVTITQEKKPLLLSDLDENAMFMLVDPINENDKSDIFIVKTKNHNGYDNVEAYSLNLRYNKIISHRYKVKKVIIKEIMVEIIEE